MMTRKMRQWVKEHVFFVTEQSVMDKGKYDVIFKATITLDNVSKEYH